MKRIIIIILIVSAFTGAGILIYKIIGGPGSASLISNDLASTEVPSEILPKGSNLNFETVKKFNKESRLFPYPAVNPGEIGPIMTEIVKQ